ncbi:DeoR/GlpR family DNA-binding transcription regulator [Phaeobacter inhibens]|uniref:DeoR/GlpR family DNA-binding transcription regulator n=1 Tax=Phaeobacter inhibens TaxID=221822 RepID=UPI00097178E8|nr:DeoR/GlpR family DNA-binding transcription regulator [Phaeobacter inhibens]APX17192.1 DeoR family transcriptional regulator [Phaeobacter inhibens]AUQ53512.1 putative glycerol-3-phosphate regulon repressor glpR [Phaeobacter inhibens]AUQ61785.1 putative glycerol-3-phosphate regulon repressor glpR [Phaeobacter inhibens]AUQ77528.1 putative glycerol-3-phosphate regulon repressor glpR [Phaeobacter inhibens]AUQ81759.1 putative glycerol-3-phosphate regulon repressor glpR [Phaeobacter inhibens]
MDATDRQAAILDLLTRQDRVEVEDLAQRFGVSLQTIRTDLRDLAARGALSRVHGGAVRSSSGASRDYAERRKLNARGKRAMAALAADLIPDNCAITLNIGTSTEQVARALSGHRGLTVLSNNINIINMMMEDESKELVLVGGAIRQSDGAIVGEDALEFIARYKVDIAVIGASAMDADGAILDHDPREVSVARAILKNARKRVLVCDGSKFERTAPVRICDISDLDVVITDRPVPPEFSRAAEAADTQILWVGENESSENA